MSGLRVIAGKARGHHLKSVPGDATRPITDRAKESLFNIIGGDVEGSSVLDLFAGTGSVGIEALSRGAAHARFLDIQRQAIDTIRSSLAATGLAGSADVLRQDAFQLLAAPPDRGFDYVFIAPPQYKAMWLRALRGLDGNPAWLSPDAWVIVQIAPVEDADPGLKNLVEFDRRQYGTVLFIFYERAQSEEQSPSHDG
jgi:16S rRNA (guanine966-N2)-methyltransferase